MIAYASNHVAAAKSVIARLNDAIFFPLITLGIALAVVVFAWGVFKYVSGEKGAVNHKQGQQTMLYGVIGLVVMLSALAILNIAAGTFGVSTKVRDTQQQPPAQAQTLEQAQSNPQVTPAPTPEKSSSCSGEGKTAWFCLDIFGSTVK